MPTLSEHRQHIETLITYNRVEEARDYCRKLSHPNARLWLSEINRLFPIEFDPEATRDGMMMTDGEIGPHFLSEPRIVDEIDTYDIEDTDKAKRRTQLNHDMRRFLIWLVVSGIILLGLWSFAIRPAACALVVLVWFVPAAMALRSILHPKSGHKRSRQTSEYPFETTPIPLPPLYVADDAALDGDEARGYFVPERPYERHFEPIAWREPDPVRRVQQSFSRNRQDIQFMLALQVAPIFLMLAMIGVLPTLCLIIGVVLLIQGAYSIIENNAENY